jgi:hypothetical protein
LFDCRVTDGYPISFLSWQRADSKYFSTSFKQTRHGDLATLSFNIKDAQEEDFGEFECVAANLVGTVSKTASIQGKYLKIKFFILIIFNLKIISKQCLSLRFYHHVIQ